MLFKAVLGILFRHLTYKSVTAHFCQNRRRRYWNTLTVTLYNRFVRVRTIGERRADGLKVFNVSYKCDVYDTAAAVKGVPVEIQAVEVVRSKDRKARQAGSASEWWPSTAHIAGRSAASNGLSLRRNIFASCCKCKKKRKRKPEVQKRICGFIFFSYVCPRLLYIQFLGKIAKVFWTRIKVTPLWWYGRKRPYCTNALRMCGSHTYGGVAVYSQFFLTWPTKRIKLATYCRSR